MKASARAVVIGGGVVGASTLYHLAKIGWTDVLLLEKSELTSGSTWHAAGGMHTFNGEANISRLQKYTIDLYREIEALSGQSCGLHPNGGLMLAATQGELDSLKLICSRARYLGMETEMITLEQAVDLNPLIDPRHFIGALWRADGGHCDPSGTTHAYVKAARVLGASVERFTRVIELQQRPDGSWNVVTDKGTVHAEHVINCAGLWAREIGHMVGIELPVLAMEHHYLLTEDIPELQGRKHEIVNTTDYAGEIYLRQERGGALIGTYEPHGKVWSPVRTPDDFSMQLLPDEFERLAPYFEVGFEHFPALGRAGIRKAINGPFTFAPDGNPLVGPGARLAKFLGRLRRHGRLQPGRRHRSRAVALDGGGRPRPGHIVDGRRALRCICDAEVHGAEGAGELCAAFPPGLSERGVAGRAAGTPLANLRRAVRRGGRNGRQLRSGACALVCAAGHVAHRNANVSPLRGLPGRARGMPGGTPHGRSL